MQASTVGESVIGFCVHPLVTAILSEEGVGQREKVRRDKKRRRLATVVGRNPPKVYYRLGLGQSAWVRSAAWEPSAAVGAAMVSSTDANLPDTKTFDINMTK